MGLFDFLRRASDKAAEPVEKAAPAAVEVNALAEGELASPCAGRAVPLAEAPDPAFAQGMLGGGCGVWPSDGVVCSPVDGEVTMVAETLHAVGIRSATGEEVLLHIGVDTVEMAGEGFAGHAKVGERVRAGQPLVSVDLAKVRAAGHPEIVLVLLPECEPSAVELLAEGDVSAGQPLLRVRG